MPSICEADILGILASHYGPILKQAREALESARDDYGKDVDAKIDAALTALRAEEGE